MSHRLHTSNHSPRYEGSGAQSSYGYRAPLTTSAYPRQHGFFSPPLAKANGLSGSDARPSPSFSHANRDESFSSRWGPMDSNSSTSRISKLNASSSESKSKCHDAAITSKFSPHASGAHPSYMNATPASKSLGPANKGSSPHTVLPPIHGRQWTQQSYTTRSSDDDGELNEPMDEDDVGGAYQDQEVLSRPLQLLAYASTAATRRQAHGGFRDPRSVAAAGALGLISAPSPLKPIVPAPDSASNKGVSTGQMSTCVPVTAGIESVGGAEPSTLENGNWEYKAGRVRAIRGADTVESLDCTKCKDPNEACSGRVNIPARDSSALSRHAAAALQEPLFDQGPHLGKRRRSDDEPLPIPQSRKSSILARTVCASDNRVEGPRMKPSRRQKVAASNSTSVGDGILPDLSNNSKASTSPRENSDIAPSQMDAVGASRKGYFRFSLYSSKLDVDIKDDPIDAGVVSLKDVEDLFDFFFNNINSVNFIFDPFLHSLAYVRARSKFLLTIIASIAARMRSATGSAELTERLEEHWKSKLFPQIVIGGYKSVEISQAFLLASLFHRPTHIIVEDRAWQYLGMAIRTATEVGVNIALTPNSTTRDNELLSRRVRNRQRLWKCLLIAEGTLSTQFGRPCTLSCQDSSLPQSVSWNREDFALPEDAALVCQIELRKIVERHTQAFERCLSASQIKAKSSDVDEAMLKLQRLADLRRAACADLETWRQTWCPTGGLDQAGVGGSMAMGAFLVRWSPYSRLIYNYWRCHLNSVILQAAAKRDEFATPVAFDSMQCARELMDILLDDKKIGEHGLPSAPNAIVVMATYAAVSALRLTRLDLSRHAFIDSRSIFEQVLKLADALEIVGRTPAHRDGAAAPYGIYLRSVLALFDNDSKSSSSVASHILHEDSKAGGVSEVTSMMATSSIPQPVPIAVTDGAGSQSAEAPLADALVETAATHALLQARTAGTLAANDAVDLTPSLNPAAAAPSATPADCVTASAAIRGDEDAALLSSMYSSDPEVCEYLGGVGATGAGSASSSSGAAALWPATSTTTYLG